MTTKPLQTLLLFIFFVLATSAKQQDEDTCRLWMGISTLSTPSAVKYGLFAGVDFEEGDLIPDVELAIPFIDFFVDPNRETSYTRGILDYLENQMWTADYSSAKFEGNFSSSPYLPGVGTLGNYHSLTANANWFMAASLMRERNKITEAGKPHLSRGSISNIDNVTMVATTKIPAGFELFPSFGDLWDKEEPSPYQDRYTRKDMVEADLVLDRIIDFYERYGNKMNDNLKEDMLDFMLDKILVAAGDTRAAMIRSLIPQNYRKLKQVKEAGGVFLYRSKDLIKKQKWFEKNGVCVDTMYSGLSTIPEAGRGAFASRDLFEGDRITLIPTLLFGKRDLMNMYEIVQEQEPSPEGGEPRTRLVYDRTKPKGQQLGINYAYGHPESSFLLLPTSPHVNFINHHSSPNAKLQWSTHEAMNNDEATWDYSVEEVMNFRSNMVVLELEATRDIKKGEEIFIDYGPQWSEAYADYQQMFKEQYAYDEWPLRAEDVKEAFEKQPYPVQSGFLPAGVTTACFIVNGMVPDGSPAITEDGMTIQQWIGPTALQNYSGTYLNLCELIDVRDDGLGSYNYTVTTRMDVEGEIATTQVNDVPHASVTLVDTPYSSDLHWTDAFRHFIGIPDEIFPQKWRDLR